MAYRLNFWFAVLLAMAACQAAAGGPYRGVEPGAKTFAGTASEWPVPTSKSARDPVIGPDGKVYFAEKLADKIASFDPQSKRFREWVVPEGMHPQGLVVAHDGKVIFGGNGIGELDPSTGTVRLYKSPSKDGLAYSLAWGAGDTIWYTARTAGKLGKLERPSGKITEYPIGDDPYAVALDRLGRVWVTRKGADRITRFDPATGQVTDLVLPRGAQPRRITVTPDGMLWVTLYGLGRLAKFDPVAGVVAKEYLLPGGPNGGPYAVNGDAAGRVWVCEVQTDSVIMLDPASDTFRVFKLPARDIGMRNAVIDGDGRYWYIGSISGKLGVID